MITFKNKKLCKTFMIIFKHEQKLHKSIFAAK